LHKIISIARLVPVLLLCALTQGCIGITKYYTKTEIITDPQLTGAGKYRSVFTYNPRVSTNHVVLTPAVLVQKWGEPTSHGRVPPDYEVWTYRMRTGWNGIIPILIIPIPLVLPTGEKKVEFYLQHGHVVKVIRYDLMESLTAPFTPEGPQIGRVYER
jgi:hypothetical protein